MAFGDSIGLLFTLRAKDEASGVVKGVAGNVEKEVRGMEAVFNRLGGAVGLSNSQVTSLSRGLPVAGAAIGGVTAVTVGAGAALFSFAKNASDAGSEIFDLQAKTGLAAESLSAVKFAADQGGSSVQEFAQAWVIYQNKLTDAAAANKTLFGIDAQRALQDQEYALRALVTLLNGPLPQGYSRSSLAAELLGRSGSNLLATFDTIGPSFERFIAQAKRMGVVLSEEDVKAADEFGDTVTVLDAQMSAVANRMALQYAPAMSDVMKEIGQFATQAQPVLSVGVKAVTAVIQEQANELRGWATALRTARNVAAGLPLDAAFTTASLAGATGGAGAAEGGGPPGVGGVDPEKIKEVERKVLDDVDKLNRIAQRAITEANERRAEEAFQARQRELAEARAAAERSVADLQRYYAQRNQIAEIREGEATELVKRMAAGRVDANEFETRSIINNERSALAERIRQLDFLIKVAKAREAETATVRALTDELKVLEARLEVFNSSVGPRISDAIQQDTLKRLDNVSAINRQAEALMKLHGLPAGPQGAVPQLFNQPPTDFRGAPMGIVVDPNAEGGANRDPKPPNYGPWHEAITGLKNTAVQAWEAMAQAFGQLVGGMAAGEKIGGRAIAAMVKQSVAAIAIESVARAVFHTGMGLAYMILNPPLAASQFAAAKTFAISAAVAGGLALAIPGGGGGGAGGGTGYGAAAYAGTSNFDSDRDRDRTRREARTGGMADPNAPRAGGPWFGEITLHHKYDDGRTETQVVKLMRRPGPLRDEVHAIAGTGYA